MSLPTILPHYTDRMRQIHVSYFPNHRVLGLFKIERLSADEYCGEIGSEQVSRFFFGPC
jgi:hypothetical protein